MINPIDLSEKFALFAEYWRPKIVAELNDNYVKLVKLKGEFVWHRHEKEDELFLVLKGALTIRLRDRDLSLGVGQFVIIPKGVEHMPLAKEEVHVMLVEPRTTVSTGDTTSDRIVNPEWI